MANNGQLPASDLADIPGGRLRKDAAQAWLAMRAYIGKQKGVWICPTSIRTAYRPYADQEYFWKLYQSGRGALAALGRFELDRPVVKCLRFVVAL